jgi:hypothetical protein
MPPSITRKEIIDYIVSKATGGLFSGDARDGKTPPITAQNFRREIFRLGAKALRARLARLSWRQVLQVGYGAFEEIQHAEAQHERALSEERLRSNRRQLAPAMAAKSNKSQMVDELIAELVAPLLKKAPNGPPTH